VNDCGTKPKDAACIGYTSIIGGTTIQFTVAAPQALDAAPADCSIGVCYRAAAPYGITFSFNNEYSFNTVVNLPNNRPAIVLPMARTSFVKRIDSAEFENGMLKKTHVEKPSEALEVASLPVNVMTAIFDSISTLVQAKVDLSGKEKALADAQKDQLTSEQALAKARRDMEAQAAVAAAGVYLLSGSSNGTSLSQKLPPIGANPNPVPTLVPVPVPNPNPGPGMFDPGSPGTNPSPGANQ
jgi:hypothetical protein